MVAQVTKRGALDMQVCVPAYWSDAAVLALARNENPCGTESGWHIRRQGDDALGGADERVQCGAIVGHVHIMLDA